MPKPSTPAPGGIVSPGGFRNKNRSGTDPDGCQAALRRSRSRNRDRQDAPELRAHPSKARSPSRSGSVPNQWTSSRRGSILIAGVMFFFLFLLVAVFAVDLSHYYFRLAQVQDIADRAALAGGQALNQNTANPDKEVAYRAVLSYIKTHQGRQYQDLYEIESATDVHGIEVARFTDPSGKPYYKVGVVAYGSFEPYFLPRSMFGDHPLGIQQLAVAKVDSRPVQENEKLPWECGVYADKTLSIDGNDVDASQANLCSNSDVLTDGGSFQKFVAEVYHLNGTTVTCPKHNPCSDIIEFKERRRIPSLNYKNPGDYMYNLADYVSWGNGVCGAGRQLPGAEWENGGGICVKKRDSDGDGTPDEYVFRKSNGKEPGNKGRIMTDSGGPVSIYADDSVEIDYNGGGIYGGLFSQGTIHVSKNDHEFIGDPDTVGGLALWAMGELDIDYNSIRIEGIVGSHGDMSLGRMGGGTGPDVDGVLMSQQSFEVPSNSDEAELTYDPSAFRVSALTNFWYTPIITRDTVPKFASTKVYLVD